MLENLNIYVHNSTKMKKIGINAYIKEDGVHIYKSRGITDKDVQIFLKERKDEIIKAYNKILFKKNKKNLFEENKVMYNGSILDILYEGADKKEDIIVDLEDKKIIVKIKEKNFNNAEYKKKKIKEFLAKDILEFVSNKTSNFAKEMKVKYNKITIKDNKTNFGSCSSRKNINYNLRLSQMPKWVAEYIVCHEVSHLVHMNHSNKFWKNVEKYYPDYKKAKEWINKNKNVYI